MKEILKNNLQYKITETAKLNRADYCPNREAQIQDLKQRHYLLTGKNFNLPEDTMIEYYLNDMGLYQNRK